MISPTQPHGREDLSALFDGELHGDASRFAHKRLAQDIQWRQACSTWQLAGDVLRGQATAAAPADFADRVRLALAHESAAAVRSPSGSRRGWVGGAALAASVAVAAWFVASPLDQALPASLPAVATVTPPQATPGPATALPSAAAADTATSQVARPASAQVDRTAAIYPRAPAAAVVAAAPAPATGQPLASASASASVAVADFVAIDPAALEDPFQLPDPPAARPWPRAVLPNLAATGALTASYGVRPHNPGGVESGAPGFYPFEPRLPPAADAASDAR
ncbi:MAG TPA: sigma-E factor negative regulatory protein [Lysobacter sp.]|nr:sigma-E factor negative regulatory protein [Lysobacter sp.]